MSDYTLGSTLDFKFTTRQFSTGAPFTLAGSPVISAYPDNSTTEITAGITLSVDFDSVTGLNNIRVVATSGNGYAAGSSYALVITTGTVDSVSVVGEVVASFTLGRAASFDRIGAAGAGLTNINLPDQTMNITGDITGNLSGSVGSVTGTIGGLTAAALKDFFDTDSTTTYAGAVAGSVVKEIADNATVAAASLTSIADAVLKRDWTAVTGEADYSLLQAARLIRNDFGVSAAGVLTVYEEDGTTVAFTKQLATVSPVRGITGATET